MDTDALNTFLAVHREGGFSNAARKLGRTQPAISQRISLLEDALGVPLFERGPGRSKLSQAGQVLLPYAERAVAALEDARSAVRALTTANAGPIALAVVGTLAGTGLSATLKAFRKTHPAVVLSLSTATSADVSECVRRGEATIGLRYFEDADSDLAGILLGRETLTVVAAPDHPRARAGVSTLAKLRGEHWFDFPAVPGRRAPAGQNVLVQFRARGLGDPDWTPVDSLTAQKRLVEAGFGLALLPESGIAEELATGMLARIPVADLKAANPIVAVVRRNGYLSAAAKVLLETLKRPGAFVPHAPARPDRKRRIRRRG